MPTKMGCKREGPKQGLQRKPRVPKDKKAKAKTSTSQKRKGLTDRERATRQLKRLAKDRREGAEFLWRHICYTRADSKCEICGKFCNPGVGPDLLAAHHIIKRSQSKRLQLDYRNSLAVCGRCHLGADRDQVRCLAILKELRPDFVDILLTERRRTDKVNNDAQYAELIGEAAIWGVAIPESLQEAL